jgi:hypothetical protein
MSRVRGPRSMALVIAGALLMTMVATDALVQAQQAEGEGFIIDRSTRAPLASAEVRITRSGSASAVAQARAGTDGRFALVAGARGILEVEARGYATKRLHWPPVDGGSSTSELEARVRLRILDESGSPISARATLTTFHPGNIIVSNVVARSGVATVNGLASGSTLIVAQADNRAPAVTTVALSAGSQPDPIALTLPKAATVRGVVADETGTPLPDATVRAAYGPLVPFGRILSSFLVARRTADGGFEIANAIPGAELEIRAEHAGKRSGVARVLAAGGSVVPADVVLTLP